MEDGLMLKLKLQCFGHLMWTANSLEKTLMLKKIEGRRERENRGWDGWMASPTQWTWVWASSGRRWRTGKPRVLLSMGSQSQTWLSNWTTTSWRREDTVFVKEGPVCFILKRENHAWLAISLTLKAMSPPNHEWSTPRDMRTSWYH